jgi:hypothetical protein
MLRGKPQSLTAALDVVANYDVSQAKNIVDVGGSHGMLLTALLQAARTANGVLFDLPHVIEQAREVVGSLGLNDRVELRGRDFFQEMPPGVTSPCLRCLGDASGVGKISHRCSGALAIASNASSPRLYCSA